MTDNENYGHEGPLVEDSFARYGEEPQKMIRCERCNCMVPADRPEELREMDCDEYAALIDAL